MENFKLIKNLEKISLNIPDRILRIEGYILNGREKEYLEIIIYKGFSSSTTHMIDPNIENDVINKNYFLTKCQLIKAPMSENFNKVLKEIEKIELFLSIDYWY
tara:strand:- start:18 stop:326 length:309 start_codon:yes stop_codon:yes gene_type:complete